MNSQQYDASQAKQIMKKKNVLIHFSFFWEMRCFISAVLTEHKIPFYTISYHMTMAVDNLN